MKQLLCMISVLILSGMCLAFSEAPDYSDPSMWAFSGSGSDMPADVFFIAPTNVGGSKEQLNADLSDEADLNAIQWGIAMQTGIYSTMARFYSPYYRQITLYAYTLPEKEASANLTIAESDVLAAFDWYMRNENGGRPVVIAGFSQGADMGLRLLKAYADDEEFQRLLVAAYLIGWRVTDEDIEACPQLKMAQREDDTGVIICFECEAEEMTGSFIIPENCFTYSINPLNWKTDSTPASREENLGYVKPGKDGSVREEIPALCGCYIDPVRGALKVTDVSAEDYPAVLGILPEGSFHIYDYRFFYRNLQSNVETRISAYLNAQ